MAFRITLECGDSSKVRAKKTPEGYTHDWEVFVRGVDKAPIHHYIEKVVFNLHETFAKPKRVIKEPPYILKECGYAGFDMLIHIYLKNKNEPKRFEIMYNLNLKTNDSISHSTLHNEIIINPSDEFRKKLLKGGATPMSNIETSSGKNDVKALPMVGKPKLSGSEIKKHKVPEPKVSSQFSELFGTPIKTANPSSVDIKKSSEKSSSVKPHTTVSDKSDKSDKSTKIKHSPHNYIKKEKSSEEKKEKKDKEKDPSKDKDKNKEKSKRPSSPSNKSSHQSSENKRASSPATIKKPTTPPVLKRSSSPSSKSKETEIKKESSKDKEKSKDNSKSTSESKSEKDKSERKKEKKKHKEDRDRKDKHKEKDKEKNKDKENTKLLEKKIEKSEKPNKDKLQEPKASKEDRKSPKPTKEPTKSKDEKSSKPEKSEKSEKSEKRDSKNEKSDKSKHKHKKRDKKDKRDGSKERDKKDRREKSRSSIEKQTEDTNQTVTIPAVATRVVETTERESSDSTGSGDDVPATDRIVTPVKQEIPSRPPSTEIPRILSPPPPVSEIKKEKSDKKRDRSKSSREDKESKKRKRKSESKGDDEVSSKKIKERGHSTSPLAEPVSSSQSPIATNSVGSVHITKTKDEPMETSEPATGDSEQVAPDSTNTLVVEADEPMIFSEEYVSQLKDLQQKIMTMEDNHELQRVVQVIAETGQYEITKKTFDFDLCTLDKRTVQRLQQFFAS